LETAGIHEDLMRNEVVSACGKKDFVGALREFQKGQLSVRLLDILCCDGCIMGSRMTTKAPLYKRRALVAAYARRRAAEGKTAGPNDFDAFKDLDLSRTFMRRDQRRLSLSEEQMNEILRSMGKLRVEDELNCGACGYETCRAHARAIGWGLAEKEMCLPYNIEQLHTAIGNLASTNEQLAGTREALVQSERLANMGQLAAGIAHEVNNPLGVVLIYAHLLLDRVKVDPQLQEDLTMIVDQADRCKRIVSGLLNFARKSRISLRETNVRELVGRALKAVTVPADVVENIEHAERDPLCEMDPDQMLQVLTNLLDNACAAMPYGGSLLLRTEGNESAVRFIVADSGMGIPRENLNKIFEPFFTTKQIGKGTGLGLAVTYGIVKMHRGDISVKSNVEPNLGPTGTTFTVTIPRKGLPET
jgi:signal transduction histidine kinase